MAQTHTLFSNPGSCVFAQGNIHGWKAKPGSLPPEHLPHVEDLSVGQVEPDIDNNTHALKCRAQEYLKRRLLLTKGHVWCPSRLTVSACGLRVPYPQA